MKRWLVIVIFGVGFAWWYPWLSAAAAIGLVVGWNVLEQPRQMSDLIEKIKIAIE